MKTLVLAALTFAAPIKDAIPTVVERMPGTYPDILSSTIVEHHTKKFLCGTARYHGESFVIRYVFSLEVDWQIWEPLFESDGWTAWNQTYYEICGDL